MIFLKNLFVVCVVVVITMSHQVDAMDWRKHCTPVHVPPPEPVVLASDFQIYQLLSVATKDPEVYLPGEVTQFIVINACKVTKKLHTECFRKYGEEIRSPSSISNFIKHNLSCNVSYMAIVDVLKTCLSYSGQSLSEIKDSDGHTVLHHLNFIHYIHPVPRQDCIKIICLVAGDHMWDLIVERNNSGETGLHFVFEPFIKELLSTAPSLEEAWWLINTSNANGQTALGLIKQYDVSRKIVEILESYRPEKATI